MIELHIINEFSPLEQVVLGTAVSFGGEPAVADAYDPKSLEHILAGTFPKEADLIPEMEAVHEVLENYGVQVFRPKVIKDYNQIFTRDIAFVIQDKMVICNMLEERAQEIEAIQHVIKQVDPSKVLRMPAHAYLEGGDVMPVNDHIFVGYADETDFEAYTVARSNPAGLEFLQETFPDYTVKGFQLVKSDKDPRYNALHLDCCFQPLGRGHVIMFPDGFKLKEDLEFLRSYFGKDKVFEITREEMYEMNSNVFSISEDVVISERHFDRLNAWLESKGFTVEKVAYSETAKMEGLLRCSTLPLRRTPQS